MKLLVISHKECWKSASSPIGWATDGGFAFHITAIGSLFDEVEVFVPEVKGHDKGEVYFSDSKIGITPIRYNFGNGAVRKIKVIWWSLTRLAVVIKKIRSADLIHVPIPSDIGTIGMYLAFWLRKPLFVRHCGNWANQRTRAEKLWRRFFERNAGHRLLALATGGNNTPPSHLNSHIHWIFSSSLLEKEIAKNNVQRTMVKGQKVRLITVSRQVRAKGTDTSLKALALLRDSNIFLDVVGDGPDLPFFIEMAKQFNITSQVRFHGKCTHSQVLDLMKQCNLFCYPTRASEGFPKVVLEAMSCGLPVITNPVSVLPELVDVSNSGVILKEDTPEELAKAIQRIIKDKTLYEKISLNAMNKAKEYSLEAWALFIAQKLNETFHWQLKPLREIVK